MRHRLLRFLAAAVLVVAGTYEPHLVQPVVAADCSAVYCAWLEIVPGNGAGTGDVISVPSGIDCHWSGSRSGTCLYQFSWPHAVPGGIDVDLYLEAGTGSYICWESQCGELERGMVRTVHLNPGDDKDVFPVFNIAPGHVHLIVDLKGTGTGRVFVDPSDIDCVLTNGVRSGTCTGDAYSMTSVQLHDTLNPADNSYACIQTFCDLPGVTFEVNQGGGTGTLTLDMSFWLAKATKITVSGSGTVVSSSPAGISCPPTCSLFIKPDSQIGDSTTFTAKPASGWHLKDWGGACNGKTGTTCTIAIGYSGESISAVFAKNVVATPQPTATARPPATPRPTSTPGATAIPSAAPTAIVPQATFGATSEPSTAAPSVVPTTAATSMPVVETVPPGRPSPTAGPEPGSGAAGGPHVLLLLLVGLALVLIVVTLGWALGRRARRAAPEAATPPRA